MKAQVVSSGGPEAGAVAAVVNRPLFARRRSGLNLAEGNRKATRQAVTANRRQFANGSNVNQWQCARVRVAVRCVAWQTQVRACAVRVRACGVCACVRGVRMQRRPSADSFFFILTSDISTSR